MPKRLVTGSGAVFLSKPRLRHQADRVSTNIVAKVHDANSAAAIETYFQETGLRLSPVTAKGMPIGSAER